MSHSRKHVKNTALLEFPEPKDGQEIVRVVELKGANIVEVEDVEGAKFLISIPSKFNKMIWISRGSYTIVEKYKNNATTKVKGEVTSVLQDDQIEHLKIVSKWPKKFEEIEKEKEKEKEQEKEKEKEKEAAVKGDDDLDDDVEDSDSLDLPGNPNRQGGGADSDED